MKPTPNDKVTRFTMRMPDELYEELKQLAEENRRSVAKQIVFMLESIMNKKES